MENMPGQLLDHYRNLKNFSQQDLADLASTSNQQISRLELDQRKMTEYWRQKLAPLLDIRPDDLRPGAPKKSQTKLNALNIIEGMSDRQIQRIIPLLDASAELVKRAD